MPIATECCVVKGGRVYIGPWGGSGLQQPISGVTHQGTNNLQGYLPAFGTTQQGLWLEQNADLGEVSELELAIDGETKELPSHRNRGGGLGCSYNRINKVGLKMKLRCGNPRNVARAIFGGTFEQAAGPVANEYHTVIRNPVSTVLPWSGTQVLFNRLPNTSLPITVTGASGSPTYTPGTDYIVTPTGILIPPTSTIPLPTVSGGVLQPNIRVNYTAIDTVRIEGVLTGQQEVQVAMDGFNDVNGAPISFRAHRAVLGFGQGLRLISDDFEEIDLDLNLLPDTRITQTTGANPLSQYFELMYG